VCGIDCLDCQEEFFVNNVVHVKDYDEHALDFALSCLAYFGLDDFELSVWLMLSSPNACLIIAGVPVALFRDFQHTI
jgi:hypothetical protein